MQRTSTQSHAHTYTPAAPTIQSPAPSLLDHVVDATLPPLLASIIAEPRVTNADIELAYTINDIRSLGNGRDAHVREKFGSVMKFLCPHCGDPRCGWSPP